MLKSESVTLGMRFELRAFFSRTDCFSEQSWEVKLGLDGEGLSHYSSPVLPAWIQCEPRSSSCPEPMPSRCSWHPSRCHPCWKHPCDAVWHQSLRRGGCGSSLTSLLRVPCSCCCWLPGPLDPCKMANGRVPLSSLGHSSGPLRLWPRAQQLTQHSVAVFSILPAHDPTNASLFQSRFVSMTCLHLNSISQVPFIWTTRLSPNARSRKHSNSKRVYS